MLQETFITAFINDPPNGSVMFCTLASAAVVCNTAGGPVGRPTFHGGPVVTSR